MASNYEVNIKLNTRTVNKQLNNLEKRISKLNKLAQGGRASRTVLRNEQEKIKKTGQRLGLENKILRKKKEQLKVDQQQLRVEQQTANAINKQRSGGGGGRAGRTGGGNRLSGALSSGIISGAFPLLFGQGPLIGAAGALGGGVGSLVGGQMGGFAGGLLATSIATPLQQLGVEAAKLGQALNPATKNVEALTAALGVTGTEFEKQIALLTKLGDEEAAFEAARQKMINLIGKGGVDNMTKFGQEVTELGNNFAKIMTLMKNSMANFIQNSGILKLVAGTVERTALLGQAEASGQTSDTPEGAKIKDLIQQRDKLTKTFGKDALSPRQRGQFALDILGREKGKGLFGAANVQDLQDARELLNDQIVANQKIINQKDAQLESEKMIEKIQKARVKDLDKQIANLERSFEISAEEFEIERQIAEMKEQGEIKDEDEIRRKLQKIQLLTKEKELADQTAAAFEKMSQTIATDISNGIKGLVKGTSTLGDMINSVLDKMLDAAINMTLFGNISGTLGGGGGFFGLLGGLFGSKSKSSSLGVTQGNFMPSNPDFRGHMAAGGPVKGGKSYIVGERGPELFTPSRSGMITPNHALGGSTSVTVNVDASGSSVEGDEGQAEQLGTAISQAIQAELIQQRRPGGILYN